MEELFKNILSNKFDDTYESIKWLCENDYIEYKYEDETGMHSYRTWKNFIWTGQIEHYPRVTHIFSRHKIC